MAKGEVKLNVLCEELFKGLKDKGCGMAPLQDVNGKFNTVFTSIVLDSLNKARD